MKRGFMTLFLLCLLGGLRMANACSCGGYPTACESYTGAEVVFVGFVHTVKNKIKKDDDDEEYIAGQKAWVQVEKVFKGKVTGDLLFRSYGSSCDPTYKEGQRWLFYAYYKAEDKAWKIHACDRSSPIENANEDLLYLQGLPTSATKTRIAGSLRHYEESVENGFSLINNLVGNKVTITGEHKTYEVYTDRNGVYEIYGLPPGLYDVLPEIPLGLKLRFGIFHGPQEIIDRKPLGKQSFLVTSRGKLAEAGCISEDFVLSSDTLIRGRVLGADGRALRNVCLKLEPVSNKVSRYFHIFDCTKADGSYTLDDMPPGEYRIVANDEGTVNSFEPFPTIYYPGTFDKEKATVVTVVAGDGPQVYDIIVPWRLPTRVLRGVLLYADGRPVANEFVWFRADEKRKGFDGDMNATTDEQGRFSLVVLDGWKGKVFGSITIYEGLFSNCPAISKMIKEKGSDRLFDVESNAVSLEANQVMENITLTMKFAYCAKTREE
jgi:hypothetical protein